MARRTRQVSTTTTDAAVVDSDSTTTTDAAVVDSDSTTTTTDAAVVDSTTTTDSTTATPDTVDAGTPRSRYVAAFIAAVGTGPDSDETAAAVAAYAALPGGARGGARADAIGAAIRAGRDATAVIALDDAIPTAAATRTAATTVDPVAVYRDRLTALLVAAESLPIPDGADPTATYAAARDAIASGTLSDAIADRARAAVAAVSRGRGGRTTVDRASLSSLGDLSLSYSHRGTVHRASLSGGAIVTADGQSFTNPTRAAQHVNGNVNVNGWIAWRDANGRTLAALATVDSDSDSDSDSADGDDSDA